MNSVVAWIVAVSAAAFLVGPAAAEVPMPKTAKAYKGEQCVEPVETMRRYHMDYLMHQRDETMREGIRGKKYSLAKCIECHATKAAGVDGGQSAGKDAPRTIEPFCVTCHTYAAVTIDCFQCHTTSPPTKTRAGKPGALFVQMDLSPPDARGSRMAKNWIPAFAGMTAWVPRAGKSSATSKAWQVPESGDRLVSELRAYLGEERVAP